MGSVIFYSLLIVFGFAGLVATIINISKEDTKDLLKKMYENNDIDEKTYIKYTKD